MKIKEIGFVAIPVTDIGRARKFYEGVLGLQKSGEFMEGKWIEYGVGDDTLAIASMNETWTPSDQGTGAALEMEDFETAIAELESAGVKFAWKPFETPVCHMQSFKMPTATSS
jgi:predicted enzyme related to lactoylglutathione lyase